MESDRIIGSTDRIIGSADLQFIQQFDVLDSPTNDINCTEVSKLLYEAFLTKFKISLQSESYEILLTYQHRVYDLVEHMHELDSDRIKSILKILDKENPYVADIVIMSWSLPRVNECLSQVSYDRTYKLNIANYNHLIEECVDHYVIKNFCIETLTKTNNVPVHCIDILWYYMNNLSVEFSFNGDLNQRYVGIKIDDTDPEYTTIGIHLTYILDMGLGQTIFKTDPVSKGPFRNFLKRFVTDPEMIEAFKTSPQSNSKNYIKQLKQIASNPKKYFGEDIAVSTF